MTRFVVDAQTLVRIVRETRELDTTHQLVAPNTIRSQALELLLQEVAEGALTARDALALHERMTELKMRLLGDRVSRRVAWDLAREHKWKTLRYAEYLAVAQLQADALVTVNADLAKKAKGIVPVAPFSVLLAE